MTSTTRRIGCLAAALVLMLTTMIPFACAAVQASYYFAMTYVDAIPIGEGKITFESDINATDLMDVLGTKSITVYEQQASGNYDAVATYTSDDYPNMLVENHIVKYTAVTYEGIAGRRYYATFELYAENDEGNETIYSSTDIVIASR